MLRVRPIALLLLGTLAVCAGCQQGPFASSGPMQAQMQQERQALVVAQQQLAEERQKLDRDNQEQSKLLAQSRQLVQQYEKELALTRSELGEKTSQLAQVQAQKSDVEQQAQALLASARRNGGATIRANNSLRANLPQFTIADVQARVDGDLVRIVIPADRIFQSGTAQLLAEAPALIDNVAAEIARRYPEQIIGVEGHTDSERGQWSAAGAPSMSTGHQVSVAQAGAVFEQIASRGRLRAGQIIINGFGANQPLYSNADPAGRAGNRRVELVVYPDRAS